MDTGSDGVLSIEEIREIVSRLAAEYGVNEAYLFGSYSRGTARSDSDVDIRVVKGTLTGFRACGFHGDLERALGRRVDLITTDDQAVISRICKGEVLIYG